MTKRASSASSLKGSGCFFAGGFVSNRASSASGEKGSLGCCDTTCSLPFAGVACAGACWACGAGTTGVPVNSTSSESVVKGSSLASRTMPSGLEVWGCWGGPRGAGGCIMWGECVCRGAACTGAKGSCACGGGGNRDPP